jgi:hypothetical protein
MSVRRISCNVFRSSVASSDNIIVAMQIRNSYGQLVLIDQVIDDCAANMIEDAIVWYRMFSRVW